MPPKNANITPRTAKKDALKSGEPVEPAPAPQAPKPTGNNVSLLATCIVVFFNLLCILTLCFMYSFSAFKLDLKTRMKWDENQLSNVFMLATLGQNVVVHLGMVCDKYGSPWSFVLSAMLKSAGLFGMWWCAAEGITNPWIFGSFFFLDTQGMSSGLIMAMKEVQRASPPKFSGLMASLSKAAFGLGAVYMTTLYDYIFRPDVSLHFLQAGVQGLITLLVCAATVPLLLPSKPSVAGKANAKVVAVEPVMPVIFSEAYFGCFIGMLVCWGGGMVWNANMASFSTAAGFSLSTQKVIRSYFYTAKTAFSMTIGPLTDLGGVEFWYLLTTLLMFASGAVMYFTDGKLMFVASAMAGGSFGAVATMIPIMSKKMSFENFGTLYALAKFAGVISGVSWNYYSGATSQALTKPGEANCIGDECYRKGWELILGTQVPMITYMIIWALRRPLAAAKKKSD